MPESTQSSPPAEPRPPYMSMAPTPRPLGPSDVQRYVALLWDGLDVHGRPLPGTQYAVVDGAAADADLHLPTLLWDSGVDHACLYEGTLAPDMAAVAPYLVRLDRGSAATRILLTDGWNRHWNLFLRSGADFATVRRHLRQFLLARDESGRRVYFRYYDPRVLPQYVESCTVGERRAFFGPIAEFVAQDYPVRNRPGPAVLRVRLDDRGEVVREQFALVRPRLASEVPGLPGLDDGPSADA